MLTIYVRNLCLKLSLFYFDNIVGKWKFIKKYVEIKNMLRFMLDFMSKSYVT